MVRRSTVAVSTLVPALKVLSTVLLDSTFFSLVRTNAGPLPGFTCWNSTTAQSWPSMLRTMPFFRSFVVAMRACQPSYVGRGSWGGPPNGHQRRSLSAGATPDRNAGPLLQVPHDLDRHGRLVPAGADRHGAVQPGKRPEVIAVALDLGRQRLGPHLADRHRVAERLARGRGVLLRLGPRLLDGRVPGPLHHGVGVTDEQP